MKLKIFTVMFGWMCSSTHLVSPAPVLTHADYLAMARTMHRVEVPKLSKSQQEIVARITFYHNHQDQFGSRLASGGRARQGVTIAAHPDFKMGQHVTIPSLQNVLGSKEFVVQDRGTAVTAKKASSKKTYVFDVYINAKNKREGDRLIKWYAGQVGDYAKVTIKK